LRNESDGEGEFFASRERDPSLIEGIRRVAVQRSMVLTVTLKYRARSCLLGSCSAAASASLTEAVRSFLLRRGTDRILLLPRYIARGYREEPLALACLSAGVSLHKAQWPERNTVVLVSDLKFLVAFNAWLSRRQAFFRLLRCNPTSSQISLYRFVVTVTFSLSACGLLCPS
jgi:hypothetical protein